jgi:stringent starvation protein B
MDKKEQEKKERLLTALDQGMVMIHLDARRPGVLVPRAMTGEAHLRLNLSYRFDPPDLTVGDWGIRSTLSFGGSRFKVAVPWSALFAITSHASREYCWLYPDDMPQELIEQAVEKARTGDPEPEREDQAPPARALLQEIAGEKPEPPDGGDEPPPRARGHLRVIK